jgi:MAPEG family
MGSDGIAVESTIRAAERLTEGSNMPRLPITSLFAALLALLLFTLTMTVIVTRMTTKTDLGDGDNPLMFRRIRAHGNFVEYVPMGPMGQWASSSLV